MFALLTSLWSEPTMLQTLMLVCLVSGLGIYLGEFKIGRFSLGVITVFFVGILAAHFGARVDLKILEFIQNFGLIIFIYALGLQVGPGFVASFRKKGLVLNLWGVAMILIGSFATLLLYYTTDNSLPNLMGVLSGAVTNTPALGAAQQAVAMADPSVLEEGGNVLTDMALATAIAYPFGAVGVIIVLEVLRLLFPKKITVGQNTETPPFVAEYYVLNSRIIGKTLAEVRDMTDIDFVISRLWRDGSIYNPDSETVFKHNDHLIIVSKESQSDDLRRLFGGKAKADEMVNWESDKSQVLVSCRLLVTKPEFNGVKLGTLRLRNNYGVNVTRINRSEMDLIPTSELRLQVGDRLTVVGQQEQIDRLATRIGNELKRLDTPYLVSIFLGIFLGIALGALPIFLPGVSSPIKLGIAGGPIVVGILMGAYGSRLHLTTYITHSANLMLRTLGLTIYLAGLGLASGGNFFQTLTTGDGLEWFLLGVFLTIVPIFLMGAIALKWTRMPYNVLAGVITGVMANSMALEYMNSTLKTNDNTMSVSYAMVYPLTVFLRVIIAQIMVGVLLGT